MFSFYGILWFKVCALIRRAPEGGIGPTQG